MAHLRENTARLVKLVRGCALSILPLFFLHVKLEWVFRPVSPRLETSTGTSYSVQCVNWDLNNGLQAASSTPYTVYPGLVGNMRYRCIVSGVSVLRVRSEKRGKGGETDAKWGGNEYHREKENNNNNKNNYNT